LKLIKGKNFFPKKDRDEARRKICGFLKRRGFSFEIIDKVIVEIDKS